MTAACRVNALVDLRACPSPRTHAALQSLSLQAQGRCDLLPDAAHLPKALDEALYDHPQVLVIAGDDQTFSLAAHLIITAPQRAAVGENSNQNPLAICFIGPRYSAVRRLCDLPRGGHQHQLARLLTAISSPERPLHCQKVHTLRLSDSMESIVKYGFFGMFGENTRALEWAHRLPKPAQKIGEFSFNLRSLVKEIAGFKGASEQVYVDGRVCAGSGWVSGGVGASGVRVGLGGAKGRFGEVLWGAPGWLKEQAAGWEIAQHIRVELEGDSVMYGWGGGLCFGPGPRVLEVTQGDALDVLVI